MKLSIITINKNNLIGLQKTVQSILDQSSTPFEHIIIDGNSDDGSTFFLESLNYPYLYWISELDSGIYDAMNKGIQSAQGTHLLFLNSGDFLANNHVISHLMENLSLRKCHSCIYYGYMRRGTELKFSEVRVPNGLPIAYLIENSLPHPATIIPRALFLRYGVYDDKLKIVSDWKFFIQCYFKRVCFRPLDFVISYFDTNGVSSNNIALHAERKLVFKQIWQLKLLWFGINVYRKIRYRK